LRNPKPPRGLSQATPSLVHLAQQLLGQTLRTGDAQGGSGDEAEQAPGRKRRAKGEEGAAAKKKAKKDGGGGSSSVGGAAAGGATNSGGGAAAGGATNVGGGVHDSREDAAAAMDLVAFEMAREAAGAPTGPLEPPAIKVPKSELSKLLVHKLPASLGPTPHLAVTHAFGRAGAPPPLGVEPGSGPGQLLLAFKNAAVANDAFCALPGVAGADSVGRPQKPLELAGGVKVGVAEVPGAARPAAALAMLSVA
jgi:hypothetical protein